MSYFRMPMEAVKALADSSDDADLLGAYATLRCYEFRFRGTKRRNQTAAGAKAISATIGCSDYRAKRLLRELQALRFGERGELALVVRMDEWNTAHGTGYPTTCRNANLYFLPDWPGTVSYLPSMIAGNNSGLWRLCRSDASPDTQRDALLMLAHLYAVVDYADHFGADPHEFVRVEWIGDGCVSVGDYDGELGYMGKESGLHFWLLQEAPEGGTFAITAAIRQLYGSDEDLATGRFFGALRLLTAVGLVCKVATVITRRGSYPLWICAKGYREAMKVIGINGGLAMDFHRLAGKLGLDADNRLIAEATSGDRADEGTGLYIVATTVAKPPKVLTTYAPRFHAPTPENMKALTEVATVTGGWDRRLQLAHKLLRAVA